MEIYIENAIHHSRCNKQIEIKTAVTAKHITFFVIDHRKGIQSIGERGIYFLFSIFVVNETGK
ncbi:hypothetical protein D7V82_17425 [bacterium 1xD8-6]|nr:hypothetical protein [Lachnospiraceae bacterium]RKI30027.1 hypothetical protein D7V72_05250 [bacterium D16-36]RKI64936.1 hypothetical protein D7V82_17425 [bacterium 1xD8-6]